MKAGIWAGFWSGIILGFFLKALQDITDIKVYTLLLNVDFIPYIGDITCPEWIQFLFHLLVSLTMGLALSFAAMRLHQNVYMLSFLLTFPTIFLYFPLSALAIQEVPAATDIAAFLLWIAGHALYASSLAFFFIKYH